MSDAQIQLLSGHASKKSLEIYQHLLLDAVDAAYQQAVRLLDTSSPRILVGPRQAGEGDMVD
ncbi:hypothetical protein [Deinococcus sp. UYEF24]